MQETIDDRSFVKEEDEKKALKRLILNIKYGFGYILSKWYIIGLAGLIGALLGFAYAARQKAVYTATTTFVLENPGAKGGLGQYVGVASMIGIDIGNGGGLFQGENILELYKSRSMITGALLSSYIFDGRQQLLIDRFVEKNGLKDKWSKNSELKSISFTATNKYNNAKQQLLHDSLMGQIVKQILQDYLVINKDKKLNLIAIAVKSTDELFAKALNEKLVSTVNEFYLKTKTKKSLENVLILQNKADSVSRALSGSINRAVIIADATPNQNPTRMAQRVAPIENAKVNAQINEGVLSTLLQNLELSKISLLKEAPLIQIVDEPILPLEKKKLGKLISIIIGGILGGALIILLLVIRKFITDVLKA